MLPKLYRDGFRGEIYSTEATRRLADIMLRDTAHIEEMEAEWKKQRKSVRSGGEPVLPDVRHKRCQRHDEAFPRLCVW
jgi:metallo-beta-lactamase family protein